MQVGQPALTRRRGIDLELVFQQDGIGLQEMGLIIDDEDTGAAIDRCAHQTISFDLRVLWTRLACWAAAASCGATMCRVTRSQPPKPRCSARRTISARA